MSTRSSTPFNLDSIEAALRKNGAGWIQCPEYFASIPSSNDYLLARRESVHGRVCIADFQTRGKGRRGKQWHSTEGLNLMFSLGWLPSGPPQSEVSLLVGLALADALKQAGIENIGLKWPNDVMLDGRKLAGVLIESRIRGGRAEMVIGIGLNIRLRQADAQAVERPWTDLAQQGVANIDRQSLLIRILTELAHRLDQFEASGFASARQDWLAYHVYQDVELNYQYRGMDRTGKVLGLAEDGALLFQSGDEVIAVNSGEVSSLRETV